MKLIKRIASVLFLLWCFLVFFVIMVLVLPFIILSTAIFPGKKGHHLAFIFIRLWAFLFSYFCLFRFRTLNKKLIDTQKAHIYVSNHNSYLDSVAIVRAIPQDFKPLGKVEMAKAPVFGLIYKRLVVMIDRKSKESRLQCVEHLKEDIRKNLSILIFPEGTMNRTDAPLANFYDGAFRLAIETQTALVPMVIVNARNLLPRKNMLAVKPGVITCVFGQPVQVQGLSADDLPALKARVYHEMEQLILKHG